ncbi:hypothetical protein PHMEG_0002378 [Phytophthora megakarya]|uniref:Fibronectin type-III domain-containing protein n=1 Tax=Phytophthora megakarya TaxID=4795 RepID=A0A225WYV9_9STRA|nr:hypothetical protein PHMEG_0002378 [Phytophthora megakarya]
MQNLRWSASEDSGGDSFVAYVLFSNTGDILYNGTSTVFTRGYLTRSTAYTYSVCAWNSAGTSLKSSLVSASTKSSIVAPSQPLQLAQSNSSGGSIGLTWQIPVDNGGVSILGYKLYRNGVWWADVGANGTTLSYLDEQNLAASQHYVYVVQATNSIGLGAMSANLDATTTQATPPNPPAQLEVVVLGGNLTATWVPAANSGGIPLTYYRLNVLVGSNVAFSTNLTTSQLTYTIFGLRASIPYAIVATSGNSIGESSTQKLVANGGAVRPAAPPTPERYNNATGLQLWMIVLKLYLPIDDGGAPINQLFLYQNGSKIRSDPVNTDNQAVLGDATSRYILDEIGPLHAGATYYFAVSAFSSVSTIGEGFRSDAVKVVTDPATLPSTPINLVVALRTSFSVFLQWDASADTGGDDVVYEIAYNNTNTSESSYAQATETTAEIPKLVPDDVYIFRVRARNSAGTSVWTPGLSAQTDVTQRGVVTFNVASLTVFENATSVTIQLVRVNGSSSTISCSYTNTGGTAADGQDYTLPPESTRSFSFVGALTVQSFNVQIINDDVYQPNPRTIILTLTDTTPARTTPVSPTSLTINILDDGDAGTIGFVNSEVSVLENARIISIQLHRLYGKSTATSARIVLFSGSNSTSQPDIGFRLPSATVDFIDGQTSTSASIVIKDNDVYDFPSLYFYLTLEMVAGAAKIGSNSVIKVVVLDDGDRSVPGVMTVPSLDKATGGMLQLKWEPPTNVGGQNLSIIGYNISIRGANTARWILTQTNATIQPLGGLYPQTMFNFTISAVNSIGRGFDSPSVSFETTNFTAPGPSTEISLVSKTGGLLMINIATPIDTGGAPITGYVVYLAQGENFKVGNRFSTISRNAT